MKKPELLLPAGSLDVLKVAVLFGADAVYIGGEAYGLRAKAHNFDAGEMREGIAFAHAHGAKVYVTANIIAHGWSCTSAHRRTTRIMNPSFSGGNSERRGSWRPESSPSGK